MHELTKYVLPNLVPSIEIAQPKFIRYSYDANANLIYISVPTPKTIESPLIGDSFIYSSKLFIISYNDSIFRSNFPLLKYMQVQ